MLADTAPTQEEYAKRVAADGGIPLCVKLLGKGSLEAQTHVGDLIRSISLYSAAEVEEAGAVKHLIALLSSESLDAQVIACE